MRVSQSIVLVNASLLALAAPALAEPLQSEPRGSGVADLGVELAGLDEIVVTARRRDESVQDVPQTVNVVTAAQVEELNLRNFTEISTVVPGLQLQSQSAFTNTATVRGVGFDPGASGNNPSVEFYLNDAPIASSFLFQSTYDFGQFELQRGPQGTLRGRASPSGSIAVTTRRPNLNDIGMTLLGTATNTDAYKLEGSLNLPLLSDVLAVRLAGVVDESRGNRVQSIWRERYPDFVAAPSRHTKSYRASVRFEPTNWVTVHGMYQRLRTLSRAFEQVVSETLINPAGVASPHLIKAFDRRGIQEQGNVFRQDQDVFVANVDFRFAGQRLSYVGSYNKQDFGILAGQDNGDFFTSPRVNVVGRSPSDLAGFDPVCRAETRRQRIDLSTGEYNQCTHGIGERESHELRLASDERIYGMFDYVIVSADGRRR